MSDLWQASIVSNFLGENSYVGQHQIIRLFRNVHTIVELLQHTRVREAHNPLYVLFSTG